MATASAKQTLQFHSLTMSLEQFRAILENVRRSVAQDGGYFSIGIQNGIEHLHFKTVAELTSEESSLPDTITNARIEFGDGPSRYDSRRSVVIMLESGAFMETSEAVISGPDKNWVSGVSTSIKEAFERRTTFLSRLRFRVVLTVFFYIIVVPSPDALKAIAQHHSAPSVIAYILGAILLGSFVFTDRLYFATFPATTIIVRTGPSRWPRESLVLILAVLSLIFSVIPLFQHT